MNPRELREKHAAEDRIRKRKNGAAKFEAGLAAEIDRFRSLAPQAHEVLQRRVLARTDGVVGFFRLVFSGPLWEQCKASVQTMSQQERKIFLELGKLLNAVRSTHGNQGVSVLLCSMPSIDHLWERAMYDPDAERMPSICLNGVFLGLKDLGHDI